MLYRLTISMGGALLCSLPASAVAQQAQSPAFLGIAHVAIRVKNVEASRDFYQRLGFQQFFAFEKDGHPTESFLKVNDRQFLELYPTTEAEPTPGFLHLCFEGQDLNALHDFDVAQGLTPTAVRKAGAGNLLFTLRGPENQNIEYTQYMPGSRHTLDRGQHLGADRIADNFYAVGLSMKDVAAATDYYTQRLRFARIGHSHTLLLPGTSGEQVVVIPYTGPQSRIYMHVPNLKQAARELKQRGLAASSGHKQLLLTDPDGNQLLLTR
ncbi:MAG: VOC family protein [Acidobacteriota bacterium]|nr:VOC family protein [Acidobacteriota bacterium]